MTETTNYGLIGCGMMGQEHLRNIALLDNARVVGVYEPDENMRQAGAPFAPHAIFEPTLDDLLKREDIDCWVIVSPNHLHMQQLEEISKYRHRPILAEKPIFTNPNDLKRIERFKIFYTAPIWVAMEYRYMPPIAALREQMGEATGGVKMLTIREHRFPFLEKVGDWNRFNANSGGTFVEKCCHFFDLMRLLVKSDPVRVMCSGGQAVNHLLETYAGESPDIWDHGYVIVDFENGLRSMLELCMFAEGSKYQEEVAAIGAYGKIEALVPGPTRFWPEALGAPPTPKIVRSPRNGSGVSEHEVPVAPTLLEAGDHNGSTIYQHQKFLEMMRKGTKPEVTLEDGIWAVRMGHAAQQSAVEGVAITF